MLVDMLRLVSKQRRVWAMEVAPSTTSTRLIRYRLLREPILPFSWSDENHAYYS